MLERPKQEGRVRNIPW